MSEGFPGNKLFEGAHGDRPEDKPSKPKKTAESKPGAPDLSGEKKRSQAAESERSLIDKLFGDNLAETKSEKDEAAEKVTESGTPEMTAAETAEALGKIAEGRELEIGAAELHGANADAAETAEAEAAVQFIQYVREEAVKEGEHESVADILASAEQQALEALGLIGGGESEEGTPSEIMTEADMVIDTQTPGEAELFLRASQNDETNSAESATTEKTEISSPRRFNPDPNAAPRPATTEYVYYSSNATGAVLLGGLVGYLTGRRRGRIKTEKKFMSVQKKLEREVQQIHTQLIDSEIRIRRSAAERLQSEGRLERSVPISRRVPTRERVQRPTIPESRLELKKPDRAEQLGRVLVETQASRPEVATELRNTTPEHVRAMNRSELLSFGEKIVVEGASLRKIYESHLIGERGLRRLISEYLNGKDIRRSLRSEMVEREIDFERDPILRDKAYKEASAKSSSQSLTQLLQKAGIATTTDDTLPDEARQARYEAAIIKAEQRRRMADTAMITVIVVLAALVTILLLQR